MPIEIFSEHVDEMKNGLWKIHSDEICQKCGHRQPFTYKVCTRCGEIIEYNVLELNGDFPIIFDLKEEMQIFNDILNATITTAKLMGYKVMYGPIVKRNIINIIRNDVDKPMLGLLITLDGSWRLKSTILLIGKDRWEDTPKVQNTFENKMVCLNKWMSLI